MTKVFIPKICSYRMLVQLCILCTEMPHQDILDAALFWSPAFDPDKHNKDMEEIDPPCKVIFMAEIVAGSEFSKDAISFLERNAIARVKVGYVLPTNLESYFRVK